MATVDEVERLLRSYRFRFTTEADLQQLVAEALSAGGMAFERERRLSAKDRPDFLLDGGLAIEIKIDGSFSELMRQVSRYAERPEVAEVIVVTTCARHARMPKSMAGKPVRTVHLMPALF